MFVSKKKLIIFRFDQLYLREQLLRNFTTIRKCYYSRVSVCKDDDPGARKSGFKILLEIQMHQKHSLTHLLA